MPVSWQQNSGNLGVFTVTGKLTTEELQQVQSQAELVIQKLGGIKILILLDDFAGWEKAEGWEDFSFAERNDQYIEKMAIVGDRKWEDLVYAFTLKGLRPFPIEYFNDGETAAAQQWLLTE